MKPATIPAKYAADTRQVCALADADFCLGGYFDDLARAHGHCSGKSAADELNLWSLTVAEAAAIIAAPTESMIWSQILSAPAQEHLDLDVEGHHRVISQTRTCSVRDLIEQAQRERPDHFAEVIDLSTLTVGRILDWHCDWTWRAA